MAEPELIVVEQSPPWSIEVVDENGDREATVVVEGEPLGVRVSYGLEAVILAGIADINENIDQAVDEVTAAIDHLLDVLLGVEGAGGIIITVDGEDVTIDGTALADAIGEVLADLNAEVTRATTVEDDLADDLADEALARTTADATLTAAIAAEAAARAAADAAEVTARNAAIAAAVDALIDGAPGALDTLNELAAALADDAAFSATITAALAAKLNTADAPELIRDEVAAALIAGLAITITNNDPGNTITIAVDDTALAELVRDHIGNAITAGANLSVIVDDNANTITIALNITDKVHLPKGLTEGLVAHGSMGATETFDLALGTVHTGSLDASCVVTFTGSTASASSTFTLILTQAGGGSHTVTWPAAVKWHQGSAPTLSTANDAIDVLTFITVDNGTTWFGFLAGKGMA